MAAELKAKIALDVRDTRNPGADKEANWLPATARQPFTPLMRPHWPREEILSGAWTPPPSRRPMRKTRSASTALARSS